MAIRDERLIKFDIAAIKDILGQSQFAAMAIGLPGVGAIDIVLHPSAAEATFRFGDMAATIGHERLGALLVTYCIRSGIKIPRQGDRRVLIEANSVTLTFVQELAVTPKPDALMRHHEEAGLGAAARSQAGPSAGEDVSRGRSRAFSSP